MRWFKQLRHWPNSGHLGKAEVHTKTDSDHFFKNIFEMNRSFVYVYDNLDLWLQLMKDIYILHVRYTTVRHSKKKSNRQQYFLHIAASFSRSLRLLSERHFEQQRPERSIDGRKQTHITSLSWDLYTCFHLVPSPAEKHCNLKFVLRKTTLIAFPAMNIKGEKTFRNIQDSAASTTTFFVLCPTQMFKSNKYKYCSLQMLSYFI